MKWLENKSKFLKLPQMIKKACKAKEYELILPIWPIHPLPNALFPTWPMLTIPSRSRIQNCSNLFLPGELTTLTRDLHTKQHDMDSVENERMAMKHELYTLREKYQQLERKYIEVQREREHVKLDIISSHRCLATEER